MALGHNSKVKPEMLNKMVASIGMVPFFKQFISNHNGSVSLRVCENDGCIAKSTRGMTFEHAMAHGNEFDPSEFTAFALDWTVAETDYLELERSILMFREVCVCVCVCACVCALEDNTLESVAKTVQTRNVVFFFFSSSRACETTQPSRRRVTKKPSTR